MPLVFLISIVSHTPRQREATSAYGNGPHLVQGVEATSEGGNYWYFFHSYIAEFAPRTFEFGSIHCQCQGCQDENVKQSCLQSG